MAFYIVLCDYIIVISPWMSYLAGKMYIGHRNMVFNMSLSGWVFQLHVTFVLFSADHVCDNYLCRGGPNQTIRYILKDCLLREYQNFLEESKVVGGAGASVVCILSNIWDFGSCKSM